MKTIAGEKKKNGLFLKGLVRLAFLAFVGAAIVSVITCQASVAEKKEQLELLKQQEEQLIEDNQKYERLLEIDDEKQYMEKIAIDKLNYAYPSERRFYDTSRN